MSRRVQMPPHLRMECLYLLRGHSHRQNAIRSKHRLTEPELKKYWAVENALSGVEITMRGDVVLSLIHRIAYEHFDVPCSRQTFYRRRHALLLAIAREMAYL